MNEEVEIVHTYHNKRTYDTPNGPITAKPGQKLKVPREVADHLLMQIRTVNVCCRGGKAAYEMFKEVTKVRRPPIVKKFVEENKESWPLTQEQ